MLSIWIALVACKESKYTERTTSCLPGGPWASMASCSILIHTNISQDNAGGKRASDLWRTYTHQQRVYLMVQLQLCWETHPVLRRRYVAVSERRMLSSRWKSRVELSNGTSSEEAGDAERYIFTITMTRINLWMSQLFKFLIIWWSLEAAYLMWSSWWSD